MKQIGQSCQAMERTRRKYERPVWPWPFTFWPGIGTWHIVHSWVVLIPHMKQIWFTETWNGHGRKYEQPTWPCRLTNWPVKGTRHIVHSWVVLVAHMKLIRQIVAKPWSGHGWKFERPVLPWPLIYWSINHKHIVPSWAVFMSHINTIHEMGNELEWLRPIQRNLKHFMTHGQ